MANRAKYRVICRHHDPGYGTLQRRTWCGRWRNVTYANEDQLEAKLRALTGTDLVSAWYDSEGRKTAGPRLPGPTNWAHVLAGACCGATLVCALAFVVLIFTGNLHTVLADGRAYLVWH